MTPSLSRRIVRARGSPVGAYCRFDSGAVNELRELLRAVAAYASGGMKGAQRSLAPQCRCDQAAGTDEIAMPTIFIGLFRRGKPGPIGSVS
jgi:hypothetical protein